MSKSNVKRGAFDLFSDSRPAPVERPAPPIRDRAPRKPKAAPPAESPGERTVEEARAIVEAAEKKVRAAREQDRKARTMTVLLPNGESIKARVADAASYFEKRVGQFVEEAIIAHLERLEGESGVSFPRPK